MSMERKRIGVTKIYNLIILQKGLGLEQVLVQRPGNGKRVQKYPYMRSLLGAYSYCGGLFNHSSGKALSMHKASMAPRHLTKGRIRILRCSKTDRKQEMVRGVRHKEVNNSALPLNYSKAPSIFRHSLIPLSQL